MICGDTIVHKGSVYERGAVLARFVCAECGANLVEDGEELFCSNEKSHKGMKMETNSGVEIRTLTGMSMREAVLKLNEQLEEEAYRKIGGDSLGFTDILPAWRDEYFNEIFGIAGYGWWFDYDYTDANLVQHKSSTSSGKPVYIAEIKKLDLFYRLVVNGEVVVCGPVPSSGYNSNMFDAGNAIKGAVTAALGKAASRMGWQLSVYKGQRGHDNLEEMPEVANYGVDFVDAAGMHLSFNGLSELAISESSLAPMAQRMLIGMMDDEAKLVSLKDLAGDNLSGAIKQSYGALQSKAKMNKEDANSFSMELFGEPVGGLTMAQFSTLWDAMVQIANGTSSREQIVNTYKALSDE